MAGLPTQAPECSADQRAGFGGGGSGATSRAFGTYTGRGCQDVSTVVTETAMACFAGASAAGQHVAATAGALL